jgi:hypothetical protein
MNKSAKNTIIAVSILAGISLIIVATTTKPKETKSNVSGNPAPKARRFAQIHCNQGGTWCPNGRMCKNGFCV